MLQITVRSIDQTKTDAVRAARRLAGPRCASNQEFREAAWHLAEALTPVVFDPMGYFLNPVTYLAYKNQPVAWFWQHRHAEYMKSRSQDELRASLAMEILADQEGKGQISRMHDSLKQIVVAAIKKEVPLSSTERQEGSARRWVLRLLTTLAYPGDPPKACYSSSWLRLCAYCALLSGNWLRFCKPLCATDKYGVSTDRSHEPSTTAVAHPADEPSARHRHEALLHAMIVDRQGPRSELLKVIDAFIKRKTNESWEAVQRCAERLTHISFGGTAIPSFASSELRGLVAGGCKEEREVVAELLAALTWRTPAHWIVWSPNKMDVTGGSFARQVLHAREKGGYGGAILKKLRNRTLIALELTDWGQVSLNALDDFLSLADSASGQWKLGVIGTCAWLDSTLRGVDETLLASETSHSILIPPLYLRPEDVRRYAMNWVGQLEQTEDRERWEERALDRLCRWPGIVSLGILRQLLKHAAGKLRPGELSVTEEHVKSAINELTQVLRKTDRTGQLCYEELQTLRMLADGNPKPATEIAEGVGVSRTNFLNKYAKNLQAKDFICPRQSKGFSITGHGMEYLNRIDQQLLGLSKP